MKVILKNLFIYLRYVEKKHLLISCDELILYPGKITALIGPSGSGKTLITKLIVGDIDNKLFMVKGKFEVELFDKKYYFKNYISYLKFCKRIRKKNYISYISQFPLQAFNSIEKTKIQNNFYLPGMTLFEYFKNISNSKKDLLSKFNDIVNILDLDLNKPFTEITHNDLSLGMVQRMIACISLVNNPAIVIGDEITSALDVKNTYKLFKILENYINQNNAIFFFITHDLVVCNKLANHVYEIKEKKVVKK